MKLTALVIFASAVCGIVVSSETDCRNSFSQYLSCYVNGVSDLIYEHVNVAKKEVLAKECIMKSGCEFSTTLSTELKEKIEEHSELLAKVKQCAVLGARMMKHAIDECVSIELPFRDRSAAHDSAVNASASRLMHFIKLAMVVRDLRSCEEEKQEKAASCLQEIWEERAPAREALVKKMCALKAKCYESIPEHCLSQAESFKETLHECLDVDEKDIEPIVNAVTECMGTPSEKKAKIAQAVANIVKRLVTFYNFKIEILEDLCTE